MRGYTFQQQEANRRHVGPHGTGTRRHEAANVGGHVPAVEVERIAFDAINGNIGQP